MEDGKLKRVFRLIPRRNGLQTRERSRLLASEQQLRNILETGPRLLSASSRSTTTRSASPMKPMPGC